MSDQPTAQNTLRPPGDAITFYDELAPWYHLLYPDWESSIVRQGAALVSLLESHGVSTASRVYDVACGIGTQTIGLVAAGFKVVASDIAPAMVLRTQTELAERGLATPTFVGDMRRLSSIPPGSADAILACDNAVTHCENDPELLAMFKGFRNCLRPGGIVVLSLRDFAAMERRNPDVHAFHPHLMGGHRFVALQMWEWNGDSYDLRLYLTHESVDGSCDTRVLKSRVYAVTVRRLMSLLRAAGFAVVERRDGVLFQPVVVAGR